MQWADLNMMNMMDLVLMQMQPPSAASDSTVRQYIVTSMGVGDVVPGQNATTNPQSVTQQASLNMAKGIMVCRQTPGIACACNSI